MSQARALPNAIWGVTLEAGADKAVISGFDQSIAWRIGIYALVTGLFIGAAVLSNAKDKLAVIWVVTTLLGIAVVLMQFFRFKLIISAAGVELHRSWAGIPYKHRSMDLASTKFEVWGTSDWGNDGGWPAREFCEIMPNGQFQEECVGTPESAVAIARFCNAHKDKFANAQQQVA